MKTVRKRKGETGPTRLSKARLLGVPVTVERIQLTLREVIAEQGRRRPWIQPIRLSISGAGRARVVT